MGIKKVYINVEPRVMLSLSLLYTLLRANVFMLIPPCRGTVKKTCTVVYIVSVGCNTCMNLCGKADRSVHVFI